MDNKKKTMLVTGAAGGIGFATAWYFYNAGWQVIGVDRSELKQPIPSEWLWIQADISNPSDIDRIYNHVKSFTSTLDAVVNNAALQITKPLIETTVEECICHCIEPALGFSGRQACFPSVKSGRRRSNCQRILRTCRSHIRQYRRLCRQ